MTTAKKPTASEQPKSAPRRLPSSKKAAATPPPAAKPTIDDAYKQLALEWALRQAFDPAAWPHVRRKIQKAPMPDEVRQVLLERVDLMG